MPAKGKPCFVQESQVGLSRLISLITFYYYEWSDVAQPDRPIVKKAISQEDENATFITRSFFASLIISVKFSKLFYIFFLNSIFQNNFKVYFIYIKKKKSIKTWPIETELIKGSEVVSEFFWRYN